MKNLISGKLRIIEKPENLMTNKHNPLYIEVINTLDVLNNEKCIQMDISEIPTKNPNYFKSYLQTLARKLNKKYRIAFSHDEDKKTIYIWKRDKLVKQEE